VPIDPEKAEEFDPFEVPSVARLLNELDDYEQIHGKQEGPKVGLLIDVGLCYYSIGI
jgi:hypothetical protein